MTAPIVWQDDRSPLSPSAIAIIGPEVGSTKVRTEIARDLDFEPPAEGQLWERLAERAEARS